MPAYLDCEPMPMRTAAPYAGAGLADNVNQVILFDIERDRRLEILAALA